MANEALVSAVKTIVANIRSGKRQEGYAGYRELFASPTFRAYDVADQRQALKLMIHAKGMPDPPPPEIVEAHRAAIEPLTELVSKHNEPADYEMLGMCHVAVGNEEGAGAVFRAALALERERNAQSDLCGALMKRVSML
ncbi:MAG TPA: hypothetical protein VIF15_22395 [Polyangiaceae bacterium]|jgi:hypothetical protein